MSIADNIADHLGTEVKDVISYARDAARRLNHPYIEPEHLLLGLVHLGAGEGKNFNMLSLFDVRYHQFCTVVGEYVVCDSASSYPVESLTGTKAAGRLNGALEHAQSQGRGIIQPEDVLYALVNTAESSCPAYQTLQNLGITKERLDDVLKRR